MVECLFFIRDGKNQYTYSCSISFFCLLCIFASLFASISSIVDSFFADSAASCAATPWRALPLFLALAASALIIVVLAFLSPFINVCLLSEYASCLIPWRAASRPGSQNESKSRILRCSGSTPSRKHASALRGVKTYRGGGGHSPKALAVDTLVKRSSMLSDLFFLRRRPPLLMTLSPPGEFAPGDCGSSGFSMLRSDFCRSSAFLFQLPRRSWPRGVEAFPRLFSFSSTCWTQ